MRRRWILIALILVVMTVLAVLFAAHVVDEIAGYYPEAIRQSEEARRGDSRAAPP